jgi:crossover junction endodeoxyribonuclease RuvC
MASSDEDWSARIVTKPIKDADPTADGLRRIGRILRELDGAGVFDHDLIVMEGPSFGQMRQTGEHVRAGLWWMVAEQASVHGVPLLVVPPATLKTYATGKGNASKDAVLAAVVKRYSSWDVTGNDVADAVVLMAIGARLLGEPVEESLPQTHLRALAVLTLPAGVA